MRQFFSIGTGFVLLGLGFIGLLIPVLPTTPFVLGAAACFSAVPALSEKLRRLPFFGDHLENYKNRKGLSGRMLALSLLFLWLMLGLSILFIRTLWVKFLLFGVGGAVTAHLLFMARPKKGGGASL